MYLKLLYAVKFYPAKYKTGHVKFYEDAQQRMICEWNNGALLFRPAFAASVFDAAKLPYLTIQNLEAYYIGARVVTDPTANEIITLPTGKGIFLHAGSTTAILTETYPKNRTRLIKGLY